MTKALLRRQAAVCGLLAFACLGLSGRQSDNQSAARPSANRPSAVSAPSASDAEVTKTAARASAKPASAESWTEFGDALMQKGRETADAAYATRADQAYRKALALEPKNLAALVGLAWVAGVRHEFESSIEWANKALAIDANGTAAYGLLGDAALEMGDYDKAFEHYQKMLDLRPDLSSYGRSAHLLFVTGRSNQARILITKAIHSGSPYAENTAWCRAQLALMLFSEGAYVPAEQVLAEGLQKLPNDYHLLAVMGKVKAAQKDYPAAIEYLRRASEIAPQQDVVASLGDLYTLAGRPEEARRQYEMVETIARLNKANGVTGDMLSARFYADHDQNLPLALRLAEEEFKTRKNVYAADTLAWCYFKNGRIDEAKRYSKAALAQNTPEAMFQYHKGMIYQKAGDPGVAKVAFYAAMSLNPNFDPIQSAIVLKAIQDLGAQSADNRLLPPQAR